MGKKRKNFLLFLSSQVSVSLSDTFFNIALLFTIYTTSNSLFATTFGIILSLISKLIGGFIATHYLDRLASKKIIITTWLVKILFILTCLFLLDYFWYQYIYITVYGMLSAIANPAMSSLLSHILKASNIVKGNSVSILTLQLLQTALWGIGIPIMMIVGVVPILIIVSVLYVLSCFFMFFIDITSEMKPKQQPLSFRQRFKEGYDEIQTNQVIRNITVMDLAETSANIIWTQSFILGFTIDILKLPSTWLGYQTSAYFVGSIIGGSLVVFFVSFFSKQAGKLILLSSLTVAVTTILYTFNLSSYMALLLNFIIGFPYQIRDVIQQSLILEKCSSDTIGRVLALRQSMMAFVSIVSLLIGSLIGEMFSVQLVYLLAGLIYLSVTILSFKDKEIITYQMKT